MTNDKTLSPIHCSFAIFSFVIFASACSAPATSSAAGPNPTEFVATRVAELLTQNAMTASRAAPHSGTPAPPQEAPHIPTVTSVSTTLALPTSGATVTPLPSPAVSNTPATPCADQACVTAAEHFWLERPIPAGYVNYPDRTYPYGSTFQGLREPHHGVEFFNPSGTPVVAAAPGAVVVAGNDWTTAYGPATHFYGNLVVVQLDQPYQGQPVFNLYAHLQSVSATVGQHVNTGDLLGVVGYTGVAIGPHLHFEVRVGQNDYFSTRNPELWLKPLLYNDHRWGAIAGRVVDTDGHLVDGYTVVIRPVAVDYDNPRSQYLTTYAHDAQRLSGDDSLQENFAIGDMPLGTYTISVNTTTFYQQTVTVAAGHITWVTFVVKPPIPTETPTP